MRRRDFIVGSSMAGAGAVWIPRTAFAADAPQGIRWTKDETTGVFTAVACDGQPCVLLNQSAGLLGAALRVMGGETVRLGSQRSSARVGPLDVELRHRLSDSGAGEDTLAAELVIRNQTDRPQVVEAMLLTALQPHEDLTRQRIHVPLSAAGGARDPRFKALGVDGFLEECEQAVGAKDFACHYLEPMASFPAERTTRALLLAPVVDIFHPSHPWRAAVFTESDQPIRFRFTDSHEGGRVWEMGRTVTVPPGESRSLHGWLYLHKGDASPAWKAFHRISHREDHPAIGWTREFKVHYFDFLSSAQGNNGRRGEGYDADLKQFREFRVGMATQHGFYPHLGDYIHPDRKTWQAMRGDKQGPAEMSLEKMRARIRATRETGAKAAVYLHPVLLDDASPLFETLRDCVMVDQTGKPVRFPWQGPDTEGNNWRASLSAAPWREHLLRQARWIMELLDPDAIVVDETFAGLGYDDHPDRAGPMSAGAIRFYRELRTLVRSFGADRAVFSSDCSMAPFVFWFDGECGDHAYPNLLGRPSYARDPVRFLAALGDKPWRPCAWHFRGTWDSQMKLARQVGAGVGVSNGWKEYTGLTGLPAAAKAAMLGDIAKILT